MIRSFRGVVPQIAAAALVTPVADVLGDVCLEAGVACWAGTVLRGDVHRIRVGAGTQILAGTVGHVTGGRFPLEVGAGVVAGPGAILHGCVLEDGVTVGAGAVILDGAVVEAGAWVAPGALVTAGTRIPAAALAAGVPARVLRPLTPGERERLAAAAAAWRAYAARFKATARPVPLA
ncbi:MAG: gamma carbonic anhydrase family protein [candidate division NC10 bacterium]|nr:gamma carbonic anhydrase family protein [candidate division NC10 bacterium]